MISNFENHSIYTVGKEDGEYRRHEGLYPYDQLSFQALVQCLHERLVNGPNKEAEALFERLHRPEPPEELAEAA